MMAAHVLPGLGLNGNFVDGQDNWGEQLDDNLELLTIAVNTRVLGTVANSGALPADPADGDSYIQNSDGHIRSWDDADEEWMNTTPQPGWRVFRMDTLEFYNWIDGVWVNEDSGPSLPAGGTEGQVLAKASGADGDAEWIDPEAASFPAGTTGHFLRKTASGVEFVAINQVPGGGTTGQVLVKTGGGYEWADPEAAAEGGVWAVVNTTTGAILAGDGCSIVRETGSRYNVTFDEARPDANYGVLFGGTSGAGGTQPYVVDGSTTVNGFSIICYNNGGGEAAPDKLMFQIAGLLPGSAGGTVPPGGTTGQVLAKASDTDGDAEWIDPPSSSAGLYRFGSFFTTTPGANEVLLMHAVTDDFTIPADAVGSVWIVGTNPSGTTVFSLRKNGVEFGTISITAGGVVTFDMPETAVAADDVLSLVAPASSNGMTNASFTFRGSY
jgi:hypothetical protein